MSTETTAPLKTFRVERKTTRYETTTVNATGWMAALAIAERVGDTLEWNTTGDDYVELDMDEIDANGEIILSERAQDMLSIKNGGTYLNRDRYPEGALFTFLWWLDDFRSVAEITESFNGMREQMTASNKIRFPQATPLRAYTPALVEECLNRLLVFQIVKTTTENDETKYLIDRDTVREHSGMPYINKLIELMD